MNNKKKMFLGIAGVGLLGLVGAGVGLLNNVNEVETEAVSYSSGARIYLDFGGEGATWAGANANVYAWVFYSTSAWENISYDSTSGFYYFDLHGAADGFVLLREDSSSAARSSTTWGSNVYWNKSGDLHFAADKNKLTIGDVTTDKVYDNWGVYEGGNATTNTTIYVGHPKDYNGTFGIYTYENITVDGVTMKRELMGAYPGKTDNAYTNEIWFRGNRVYEVSVPNYVAANANIIISVQGDLNKSASLALEAGKFYCATDNKFFYEGGDEPNVGHGVTISSELATEFILVKDIQAAINATANKSVCEVASGTASGLMTRYNAVVDKSVINAAKIYTHSGVLGSEKADVAIEDIVVELSKRASAVALNSTTIAGKDNHVAVIVTISCIAALAIASFVIVSKKKQSNR